jgi:hypothetical protein
VRTRHTTTALAGAALLLVSSGVAAADEHGGLDGQVELPTSITLGEPAQATIELENTGEGDVTDITLGMTMRGYEPDELTASVEALSGPVEGESADFEFSVAEYTASLPSEGEGFTLEEGQGATIEVEVTIEDAPGGGQWEIVASGERDGDMVSVEGFEAFELEGVEEDDDAVEEDDDVEEPEEIPAGSGGLADTRTVGPLVLGAMLLGALLLLGGLLTLRRPVRS